MLIKTKAEFETSWDSIKNAVDVLNAMSECWKVVKINAICCKL